MEPTDPLLSPPDSKSQIPSLILETLQTQDQALSKILSELEHRDLVLKSHSEGIRNSDISKDGLKAVTASDDKTVIVWNLESFSEESIVTGFNSALSTVAISPNSSYFAAGSEDGFTKVWEMSSKSFISSLRDQNPITSLVFSNDSLGLAIGVKDGTIKIWNFLNKKEVFSLFGHKNSVISIIFLKSLMILSCSNDGTVKLWDLESKKLLKTLEISLLAIMSTTVSPSGNTYALGLYDGSIKINKIVKRQQDQVLQLHNKPVLCLGFSSSCRYLLSSSDDSINIYDVLLKTSRFLFGHSRIVTSLKFIKNDSYIWSTSFDKTIRVWVTGQVRELNTVRAYKGPALCLACSFDGKYLASGASDCAIRIWMAKSMEKVKKLKGHSRGVSVLRFSADGLNLFSGGMDCVIKVWSLANFTVLFTLSGHSDSIKGLILPKQGKTLISASEDCTVRVWDLASRSEEKVLISLPSPPENLKFSEKNEKLLVICQQNLFLSIDLQSQSVSSFSIQSPKSLDYCLKSNQVAIGCSTGHIVILNPISLKLISHFQGHDCEISCILLSKSGELLITGSSDCSIKMFQLKMKQEIFKFAGHTKRILSLAFSFDEEKVFSSSGDFSIRMWKLSEKEPDFSSSSFNSPILCASQNPVQNDLAIGLQNSSIFLFNFHSKNEKFKLTGHLEAVITLSFSLDGKYLASGSLDFSAKVWDLNSKSLLLTFKSHSDQISRVKFTIEGSLVTSSADRTLRIWDINENVEKQVFRGFSAKINDFLITHDQKQIITATADKTVKIWDRVDGKLLEEFWKFESEPLALDENWNSSFICIALENFIKLVKMGTKKEVLSFEVKKISFAVFSLCGTFVLAGTRDGGVKVFNLNERRGEYSFKAHKGKVNSIITCPGNKKIITISDDCTIKSWTLHKRKQSETDSFISFPRQNDFTYEDEDPDYFSLLNPDYQNCLSYLGTIHKLKEKSFSSIGRKGLTMLISDYSFSVLHIIAYLGEVSSLKSIKTQKPVPIKSNFFGNSPLFLSINKNNPQITDRLLKLIIKSQKYPKVFFISLFGIRNDLGLIIKNSSKYLAPLFESFGRIKSNCSGFECNGNKTEFFYFSKLSFENYSLRRIESQSRNAKVFYSRIMMPKFVASEQGLAWIKDFIDTENKKIFKCKVVQTFLDEKWSQVYLLVYAQSLILLLNILLPISILSSKSLCCTIFYCINLLLLTCWECLKIHLEKSHYYKTANNIFSTLVLFSNFLWITFYFSDLLFTYLNIFVFSFNFLKGLSIFKASSSLRMLVKLIKLSLIATKGYFILFIYFIFAFGIILSLDSNGFVVEHLLDLPLKVLSGEISDYNTGGNYFKDFLVFLGIFCNFLVLANLLIPVLIKTYKKFQKRFYMIYYEDLACILYEVGKIKSLVRYKDRFKYLMTVEKAGKLKFKGKNYGKGNGNGKVKVKV